MKPTIQFISLLALISLFPVNSTANEVRQLMAIEPIASDEEKAVLMAEKSRFKAMVDKDLVTLDLVIHEDLVYIHSNGSVDTKESYIAAIKDGSRAYSDITMQDAKVRLYGEVGIINARCTYHRTTPEGRPNNLSLFYTSVYAKIDGRWQQVSWQSYKVSE